MKKVLIAFLLCIASFGVSNAQEIGVRFGEVIGGNNVAIDGILAIGKFSRIHADVSFGNGVGIDAIYDFVYRPIAGEALNWYLGVGVNTFLGDPFLLGIPGELGIEYRFGIPLSVSADWRPTFILLEDTDFSVDQFGVNIRFVLN